MLHQALAGLLKDIHRVVSKLPVLFCLCTLGCCPGERRMFSRPLLSRLSIRMSLHIAAFFWQWWVSHFLQPRRMMLLFSMDGVGQVMIDVWHSGQRYQSVSSHQRILFFMDKEMDCSYLLLGSELCLDTLPYRRSAAEMVILLKVSSLSIAQQRWNYV